MSNQKKTNEQLSIELQKLQQAHNSLQEQFKKNTTVLKQDETNLKALAEIVERSVNEIYVFDINTLKFKYVNAGALNNLGFSREEFFSITPVDIKPEFTHASFSQVVQPLLAGEKDRLNFETIHQRKDGSTYPVDVRLQISDYVGEKAFVAIILDITERKLDEEAIQESEEKYRSVFTNSASVMLMIDPITGKIVDANTAASQFYGYTREKLTRMKITEINMLTEKEVKAEMVQAVTDNRNYFLFKHRLANGSVKLVEVFSSKVVIKAKTLLYSIVHDITEHKQSETKLEKAERQLSSIYDSVNDIIYYLSVEPNETYRFISVNNSFLKVTGLKREQIEGLPVDKVIPEPRITMVKGNYKKAIEEKKTVEWEEVSVYPAGEKTAIVNIVPIFDENGICSHLVGSVHDITERKRFESELIAAKEKAEESDRLKSAFLANMSHEIRTPMNGILGFTNMLSDVELDDSERQKYTAIINRSGNRLMNTINDLIDISKIEAGQMEVVKTETSINKMFDELYSILSHEAADKELSLISLPTSSNTEVVVLTDNSKLYGILTNLIKNAIKYTDKGSISFGYTLKDDFIEFYVKDTGIGVPQNKQQAIFNRFEQADIADKRAFQGSGLGLAISKAYTEMLGGKIWVESEEGVGSTFYFTLPYQINSDEKLMVADVVSAKEEESHNRTLKILITEDDETSETLLSIIVKKFSKELLKAKTGKEAVEICRKNSDINLILMDIQMPDMDGYEATRQIRQFNGEVIIIAQTAYGLSGDKEKAIEAGCSDYISKPINRDKLLVLIQKYFKK